MKKLFAILSLLISLGPLAAGGEIYIALTNFPAQGPVVDHKLIGAPHPKSLSVCRDPVSHLHQDWATSTALHDVF